MSKFLSVLTVLFVLNVLASDHLDTPTVIADPAADIGDLYAWSDGHHLNLIMTLVAHQFSDKLQYKFHIDSGPRFGETTKSTSIVCTFNKTGEAKCNTTGRVFAGLRDDPFFNNVKGTRAAYGTVSAKLQSLDAAGCPAIDKTTAQAMLDQWRHTDGGPAKNTLENWKSATLVIAVDLDAVNKGGKLLAVWAGVYKPNGERLDRIGRPLTGNSLIGLFESDEFSNRRKEEYNRAAQKDWPQFIPDIRKSLALYDGFDGTCGNQWLNRYHALATMLADDRLWINSKSSKCTQYLAVELAQHPNPAEVAISGQTNDDCGGRTPNYDASDVFRSLLTGGLTVGVTDGVDQDDHVHSTTEFPFLSASAETTSGTIAIANLDGQIAQQAGEPGVEELLLLRSRFLNDHDALDRAVAMTESGNDLLRRARTRAAVHRFSDALSDVEAAENQILALRASILTATGRSSEVIPQLEAARPSFASRSALANAYASIGKFEEADRMYVEALADLDTTSPFPYAWIYFARGWMWSEQAGNRTRGEALYRQALDYLPQFVAAARAVTGSAQPVSRHAHQSETGTTAHEDRPR